MKSFKQLINEAQSIDDLHKELSAHYKYDSFGGEHLHEYTHDSRPLNKYQWKVHNNSKTPKVHRLEEKSGVLDAVMNHNKTPHDMTVWSGLHENPHDHAKFGVVHHPAYLSTSISPKIARDFGSSEGKHVETNDKGGYDKHIHVLKLHVPKGSPGAYVGHISSQPNEKEFVMPRGQSINLKHEQIMKKRMAYGLNKNNFIYHIHHGEIL